MTLEAAPSIEMINVITGVLLGLFNLGMVARVTACFIKMMSGDEDQKKRVLNCIKATVVIDCVVGLIAVLKNYFM